MSSWIDWDAIDKAYKEEKEYYLAMSDEEQHAYAKETLDRLVARMWDGFTLEDIGFGRKND